MLPGSIAYAVRLCLEEAVVNLIDYTPATGKEPDIAVELDWQDDTLVAVVEDQGPPFDLRAALALVRPSSLETALPTGRGIHLIRSCASKIGYDSVQGRNRLTLHFARPASAAHAVFAPP